MLHCSHESSLPVSRTMVTFCEGVPTARETVRVTLWVNGSLLGALGRDPVEISWVFRGKTSIGAESLLYIEVSAERKKSWVWISNIRMQVQASFMTFTGIGNEVNVTVWH